MDRDASRPAEVRRVVLIGFSCTGKSRVCSLLAQQLGWRPVDTDDLIVALAGKPIERIFAEDGETHFRAVERAAVAQACVGEQRVIATGGGAPVAAENRRLLFRSSLVVALQARPETILKRLRRQLAAGAVRPLLDTPDPLARIRSPAGGARGRLRTRTPDGQDGHLAAGPHRRRHQGPSGSYGERMTTLTARLPASRPVMMRRVRRVCT